MYLKDLKIHGYAKICPCTHTQLIYKYTSKIPGQWGGWGRRVLSDSVLLIQILGYYAHKLSSNFTNYRFGFHWVLYECDSQIITNV